MSILTAARDIRDWLNSKVLPITTLLATVLLAGCPGGGSGTSTATLQNTAILPSASQTVEVGKTVKLAMQASWSDNTKTTVDATWTSSDAAIATVGTDGTVTAVAVGTVTITGKYGDPRTVTVTVVPVYPVSIQVSADTSLMYTGGTKQLTATGTYSDNSTKDITADVTWKTDSPGIVSISSAGVATALASGIATISADLGSGHSGPWALNIMSPSVAVLSASKSALLLSVQNTGLNAALTGMARTFQITNSGTATAFSLGLTSQNLPTGTTVSSTCGGDLAMGASCEIEVVPGATPTAAPGVTPASGATITLSASNSNTLQLTVHVLTYGSVVQGGYVFSIDDTTAATSSVTGQVVGLTDRSAGVQWSGATDAIYGINEYSTAAAASPSSGQLTGMSACKGGENGACNSTNIKVQYAAVNSANYAAGVCTGTSDGYSDWYLPAICQLGYDTSHANYACGFPTPVIQNIQSNLVNNGDIGGFSGQYWSSTQEGSDSANKAWQHTFGASPVQAAVAKSTNVGARCVRDLTE